MKDDKGQPLNSLVFKPKDIYHTVRNVAARFDCALSAGWIGARLVPSAIPASTCRKTTPDPMAAITPSTGCFYWQRPIARLAASSRRRNCSTSPLHCWTSVDTRFQNRCRDVPWSPAWKSVYLAMGLRRSRRGLFTTAWPVWATSRLQLLGVDYTREEQIPPAGSLIVRDHDFNSSFNEAIFQVIAFLRVEFRHLILRLDTFPGFF